jgi:hypothetical protein
LQKKDEEHEEELEKKEPCGDQEEGPEEKQPCRQKRGIGSLKVEIW